MPWQALTSDEKMPDFKREQICSVSDVSMLSNVFHSIFLFNILWPFKISLISSLARRVCGLKNKDLPRKPPGHLQVIVKVAFTFYSYRTSFGKKYGHFNLLCKQIDVYLRKVYIVRKVTSAPTFLA